jgi:hypothetical protein
MAALKATDPRFRLQRSLYVMHTLLVLTLIAYAIVTRDFGVAALAVLFGVQLATDLSDRSSVIRTPASDLVSSTIKRRESAWLDRVVIGLFLALSLGQFYVLGMYGWSSFVFPTLALVSIILALTVPSLDIAVRKANRQMVPWIELRRSGAIPFVLFMAFCYLSLQTLVFAIWTGEISLYLLWGILTLGMLSRHVVRRRTQAMRPRSSG